MAVVRTGDLGWTAGQNVDTAFPAQIAAMSSGDVLVLDHMYTLGVTGTQLPDNFTLAAGAAGAGLDIIGTSFDGDEYIFLGEANTLLDLTITSSSAPTTGYSGQNPVRGTDYDGAFIFVSSSKNTQTVRNCKFSGNITSHLDFRGGNNHLIEDVELNGGFYQIRMGVATSPIFRRVLSQDAMGDGIKTIQGASGAHVNSALVDGCVFLRNNRDGIDTTGGFKNSTIQNSYFVYLAVGGMDIKSIYDTADDFALGEANNNGITVNNCEFISCGNGAMIVTTIDRTDPATINSGNATTWAVQNINMNNSIVERNATQFPMPIYLVKDSTDIHWTNVQRLGLVDQEKLISDYTWGLPTNVNGTDTTGPARATQPDSYYQGLAGHDHSSITYGSGAMPAPAVTVSYTPSATVSKRIQDAAGNESSSLSSETVTDS